MRLTRWLLLLCLALAAAGAQETASYQARLVTSLPAEQAEVELLGPGPALTTRPDAVGLFRFDGLKPGVYQVTVTFPGGPVVERYVTVRPNGARDHIIAETPRRQVVGTVLWSVLAALLGVALGSGILLYGRVREHAPPLPWGARPQRGRRAAWAEAAPMVSATVAWCLSWLLMAALAPELQPMLLAAAAPVSAILGALLGAALVLVAVSRRPRWTVALGTLAAGIGLVVLCRFGPAAPDLAYLPAWSARLMWLGIGLGLLAWTASAGWLLSLGCRQSSYVVLAALVGALLDIYLVFFGHTGEVMSSASSWAMAIRDVGLLPWPVLGSDLVHGVVGWGDYVFLALFLAAAQRFDLGLVRNFWAQAAALTIGFTLGHVLTALGSDLPGLPALPFMAAFLILANRGRLHIADEDRRRILWFVGVLTLVLAARAGWRLGVTPNEREDIAVTTGSTAAGLRPRGPWSAALLAAPAPALRLSDGPVHDGLRMQRFELVSETIEGRPVTVRGLLARAPGASRGAVLWVGDAAQPAAPADLARLARAGYTCLAPDLCPALDSEPDSDLGAWPSTRLVDAARPARTGLAYHQGLALWRCAQALTSLAGGSARPVVVAAGEACVPLLALAATAPGLGGLVLADVGPSDKPDDSSLAEALERCAPPYRDSWREVWAPELWAPRVTTPVLQVAATNQPDWRLSGALRLQALLVGRHALHLSPNADSALPGLVDETLGWLGRAPAGRDHLKLTVRAEGDRLLLGVGSATGIRRTRLWISANPWQAENWTGRWWSLVEPSRGTRAEIRLTGPARSVAVVAQAETDAGLTLWSDVAVYDLDDLGIVPRADTWQSPVLALTAHGRPVFRPALGIDARGLTLEVAVDGALELALPPGAPARPLALVTHQVQVLRRLGGQARALALDLDAGTQGGAVTVEIGQREGVGRCWFATTVTPTGAGRRRLLVDPRRLTPLSAGTTLDWARVDTLQLRTRRNGTDPLRLYAVELVAGDDSVHEVNEQ